jgi:hypothetical protein
MVQFYKVQFRACATLGTARPAEKLRSERARYSRRSLQSWGIPIR